LASICILGDLNLDFITHRELQAEVARFGSRVKVDWVASDAQDAVQQAAVADGVWLIPGTPYKNDSAVLQVIEHARTSDQPFLGSCGGFQYALVEFARHVAGNLQAQHGEVVPDAEHQVVTALSCSLIAQERMVHPVAGTRLAGICGVEPFMGYHYCNYGLSGEFEADLQQAGLVINAFAKDAGAEGFELTQHAFFIATLFQPQVGALDNKPQHALIQAFLSAVSG